MSLSEVREKAFGIWLPGTDEPAKMIQTTRRAKTLLWVKLSFMRKLINL